MVVLLHFPQSPFSLKALLALQSVPSSKKHMMAALQ
jgi:hypothetical protein